MNVLNKIKGLMKEQNWSEYRLAKAADIPQSTINSMFRKNTLPSISTLENLCKAFGITLSEFFAEGENPESLTAEQLNMFKKWSQLTSEQKDLLLKLIDQM